MQQQQPPQQQQAPPPTGAYMELPLFPHSDILVFHSGFENAIANELSIAVIRIAFIIFCADVIGILFDVIWAATHGGLAGSVVAFAIIYILLDGFYFYFVVYGVKMRNPECCCGCGYIDVFYFLSLFSMAMSFVMTIAYWGDMMKGEDEGVRNWVNGIVSFLLYTIAVVRARQLLTHLRLTGTDRTRWGRAGSGVHVVEVAVDPRFQQQHHQPQPMYSGAYNDQQQQQQFAAQSPHQAGAALPTQPPAPYQAGGTYVQGVPRK